MIRDMIGKTVRFAPNPRMPNHFVEAKVIRHREDSREPSLRSTQFSRGNRQGWLDTIDEDEIERSVRPSRCTIIEIASSGKATK